MVTDAGAFTGPTDQSIFSETEWHKRLFGGEIFYADAGQPNDNGDGRSPHSAKQTIGAALALMAAGDALNVKAGTYTEVGIDVALDGMEIWCQLGVILDPASGTALTLSGDYCLLTGYNRITPAVGATGISVTGEGCVVEDSTIIAGAQAILVTGSGCQFNRCAAGFQTSVAYALQGIQTRMYQCKTVGNAATVGYQISGGVDTGVLEDCTSAGHATSGFQIQTGSQDWTIKNCSSGAGDGPVDDADHTNVWSNFTFADKVFKLTTFTGASATHNIFKVTGSVRLKNFHGHVTTVLPNPGARTAYIELFSAGGAVDITDSPGPNISALVAGAVLIRNADASVQLDLGDPNGTPAVVENTSFNSPVTEVDIIQDAGVDTFVRLVLSNTLASGAIHWHAEWEPLSHFGFLEAV